MGELEQALAVAERRATELQSWADAADADSERLRERVKELEERPAPKPDGRLAELQAWVDTAEDEAGRLRARVAELEAGPAAKPDGRVAELQAWVDAAEADAGKLRSRAAQAEAELAQAKERLSLLGDSVGEGTQLVAENRKLVDRVSELESVNHSLRALSEELAGRVQGTAKRDVERLTQQLEEARASGLAPRVVELEAALTGAREAVATLEVQHTAAVEQVRRYVDDDAQAGRAADQKHQAELVARERAVAALEAQLAGKFDEVAVLQVRVKAHASSEQKLETEVAALRERACKAEQSLGALQSECEVLRDDKAIIEARAHDLTRRLEETQRWLAQGELDNAALNKQVEAAKVERAVVNGPGAGEGPAPAPLAVSLVPPPPPEDATRGDELEGFSAQHLHRLEALLAMEMVKTGALERFVQTSEASLRRLEDELGAATGRLADLGKRLGLSATETEETSERLEAARRELHALVAELSRTRDAPAPGALEEELDPEDVIEAPLAALEALAEQQADVAREATAALAGEQRAREQLVGDLTWLKAELEKLSNVREDLRHRIHAMVQRELKRKQVMGLLLQKLRSTEVASAARAGTLRRLHAAMELAQKTAVRVQTVYFQKQIGSLQRQLETALELRKPARRVR